MTMNPPAEGQIPDLVIDARHPIPKDEKGGVEMNKVDLLSKETRILELLDEFDFDADYDYKVERSKRGMAN